MEALDIRSEASLSVESDEDKPKEEVEEDNEPQIPIPQYTEEELDKLVEFVQNMTTLFDLHESDWTEDCVEMIRKWFLDVTEVALLIFYDGNALSVSLGFPAASALDFTYFLRPPGHIFTVDGFHDDVQFGTMQEVDGSMLALLEIVFAPIFFEYSPWSESVKSACLESVHNFLANVNHLHYKMAGLTVLYIPTEGMHLDPLEAVKDARFLKRLESVATQWMSQIRTALADTDQMDHDTVCPSDEYDFWLYRRKILSYRILQIPCKTDETLLALTMQIKCPEVCHIMDILEKSQSIYRKQLAILFEECQMELKRAESNYKFLSILVAPSRELENVATPLDIPAILPKIMHSIYLIWTHSSFYNSPKGITGLFRALSNHIILYCRTKIDTLGILRGRPNEGVRVCLMALDCCIAHKEIYESVKRQHADDGDVDWRLLDEAAIFNHIDTFMRRLGNMVDICESMMVFGRYNESQKIAAPRFGGTRGPQFEGAFRAVERMYNEGLEVIKREHEIIFDVRNNTWQKTMDEFRVTIYPPSCEAMLRDLEEIVENWMDQIFQTVRNVDEGVEALCALTNFYNRKSLQAAYVAKVVHVWTLLIEEINDTNTYLLEYSDSRSSIHPKHAGRAIIATICLQKIIRIKNILVESVWMVDVPNSRTILEHFDTMERNVKHQVSELRDQWANSVKEEIVQCLQRSLMIRSVSRPGLLECNIDRKVLMLFDDIIYFLYLGFPTPIHLNLFFSKYEATKLILESVLTVVLDYNRIITGLSDKERLLFKALIKLCDKKVTMGIYKLNWAGDFSDSYIHDCVMYTSQVQEFVNIYKISNNKIVEICENICDLPIIRISTDCALELKNVEEDIMDEREKSMLKLTEYYKDIVDHIVTVHQGFEDQMENMMDEWSKYVEKIDALLLEALHCSVKYGLESIFTRIHGDGTLGPNPLVKVEVNLMGNHLAFTPSIDDILSVLLQVFSDIMVVLKGFPRLVNHLNLPKMGHIRRFHDILANDEECLGIFAEIQEELRHMEYRMETYCDTWAPFRSQWELDKEVFMENYEATNPTPEMFHININRYTEVANLIANQENVSIVGFLAVNSVKLKNTLIQHIDDWQSRHTHLLKKRSCSKIEEIYAYMEEMGNQIVMKPRTADAMRAALDLHTRLTEEVPQKEASFQLIKDHFATLDKHNISVSGKIQKMLFNLEATWEIYLEKLKDSGEMLMTSKDQFFFE
ncbi:dynein axonemal heavy chain 2 [Lutzomyia longipalpis]|uniref:dynein axonemal heavy chain 2 n=1 Tax=Lutzomyia longipalpis TaxID=7200 RepID=UPI0024842A49|nr:dynein axonemal heavy chain 2 [Lutzomyia longipalpis]